MSCPLIILCGGRATRLAQLFPNTPKALVPVAGRPFLMWQLEWVARQGVRRIHLAAGHLADRLVAWLDATAQRVAGSNATPARWQIPVDPESPPLDISLSAEPAPLGTGGGLRHAAGALAALTPFERVLVLNGDSLLPNFNLQSLERELVRMPNPWTAIAITPVSDATRFGTVRRDGPFISGFAEKGAGGAGWINAGAYAMTQRAVASIPADRPSSIELDWFPRWAAARCLLGIEAPPPLHDIGTPEGLAELERTMKSNGV
ncbi:MAG: sugar phosphate nucleotidyltransferase [Kiritimatiellae bacterium]|nr:sugar phosphate nucleotidyltransferase [Kiritimatiellia bacterium]